MVLSLIERWTSPDRRVIVLHIRAYELSFYFFFQAEDGIRDLTVTGVQTCALPISPVELVKGVTIDLEVPAGAEIVLEGYIDKEELVDEGPFGDHTGFYTPAEQFPRSEERRVGEECRSRWSPYP